MGQRSYTREEMEEILRRAAERTHAQEDEVRHDDLVAAAREVGIDETAIDRVVEELGGEQETSAIVARHVESRRARFWQRGSTLAIVTAFALAIDYLTPGGPWAQWVALGAAFVTALTARGAFLAPSSDQVNRLVRSERKKREREAKRAARRKATEAWTRRWRELGEESARAASERQLAPPAGGRLRSAETKIDRAIEEGVTQLVEALARRALSAAERLTAPPVTPRTDFERYVAKEKGSTVVPAPTPVPPAHVLVTPPPKTRVALPEEPDEADEARAQSTRRRRR